jgi:hypothetical protein
MFDKLPKFHISAGLYGCFAVTIIILAASASGYENFHGKSSGPKTNYDSLFSDATPLANSPEGQEVIDLCLKAYGGAAQLEQLQAVKIHWRMLSMMSSDSVDVIKTVAGDRRYKIERERPLGSEIRMINGNQAWFQGVDTLIELNGGRYKAELFSYLVMSMPMALKTERFDEIRYGRRADDPLHYIYLNKSDSLLMVIGIDPAEYLIKKAEGIIQQDSESFVFVNYFDDYKEHDGFLFPHSLTNKSMGLTVGESILKDVKINFRPSDSEFLPESPRSD